MNYLKNHFLLLLTLLLGLVLRLYNLTAISLWHDEAFSALLLRYSWPEMLHRIGLDVHPPAYYIFLRTWDYVFGNSLYSLRGFSVLFGVGTIILVYALIKAAFKNERAAIIAAFLVAVSPFQIQYVTEARMYTMGAFFALLTALFIVQAMQRQKDYHESRSENPPDLVSALKLKRTFLLYYAGFVLSAIVIIYTHYYLLFVAAAIGFYGLLYHWHAYKTTFRRWGWLILSFLLIGLSYLPWLPTFLYQFRQVGGNYWIPPMNGWSIPDTIWRMLFGLYTNTIPSHTLLVVAIIVTLIVLLFVLRRIHSFHKWLVSLAFIAPFAGAVLFAVLAKINDQSSSVYLVRYFLFVSAFYLIIIALWLDEFRPKKIGQIILVIVVAVNLFAYGHDWYTLDVKNKTGMAGAARFLEANVEPHHKLYVGSSFEFFNFKYYNRTPVKPLLYSGGTTDVSQMPHYAGTAILTNDDLIPDFKAATKNGDTVWLIWTNGFGGSKPQVPTNWTQIDEQGFADVRPYLGTWVIVTEYKVN